MIELVAYDSRTDRELRDKSHSCLPGITLSLIPGKRNIRQKMSRTEWTSTIVSELSQWGYKWGSANKNAEDTDQL